MKQILIEKMLWHCHADDYEDDGAKVFNYSFDKKEKVIQQILNFITEDKDTNESINIKRQKLIQFFNAVDKNEINPYVSFELNTDYLFTDVFDSDEPEEIRFLLSIFDVEEYQKKLLKKYEQMLKEDLNAYKQAGESIFDLENSKSYMSCDF